MRPPMTTTKNDGLSSPQSSHPHHNRKTQLTQKEVLAENQKFQQQQQQQQQRSTTQQQTTTSLINNDNNDDDYEYYNIRLQQQQKLQQQQQENQQQQQQQQICTSNIKLKEQQQKSIDINDIIDNDDNNDISLSDSKQINQITINKKNLNSNNLIINSLGDVPKNIFINNFDKLPDTKLINKNVSSTSSTSSSTSSVLIKLPLSETEPLLTNIETTVTNPKRSICLNKNSASLIFTKKDLSLTNNNNNNNNNNNLNNINTNSSKNNCNNNISKKLNNNNNNNNNKINTTSFNKRCKSDIISSSSGANKRNSVISDNNTTFLLNNDETTILQQQHHHRRSLQLNYSTISNNCEQLNLTGRLNTAATNNNRKQHAYSWYAPVYSALEEEFEQDSKDSSPVHNLNSKHKKNRSDNDTLETLSLLGKNHNQINILQPQLHQQTSRIRRQQGILSTPIQQQNQNTNTIGSGIINQTQQNQTVPTIGITNSQNDIEGPHATSLLGGPLPRRRRFENFLKSLVGRKPSKELINNPPLIPSPDLKISQSPSETNFLNSVDLSTTRILTKNDKITNSTTSLNSVQHKLWNVVPLLKRENSSASLQNHNHHSHNHNNHQNEKVNSIVQYSGLRKCETVLALTTRSSTNGNINGVGSSCGVVDQIKPLNRLRNSSSTTNATCSRCSSLLSLAASGSRYSLNLTNSGFITTTIPASSIDNNLNHKYSHDISTTTINGLQTTPTGTNEFLLKNDIFTCKLCLAEIKMKAATTIGLCGCTFCTECMTAYIEFEISEGAYEISCPDAQCPTQGIISLPEITSLTSGNLIKKHHRYRLNREIELDKTRTWCPRAGCETVCMVGISPTTSSSSSSADKLNSITQVLCAVQCPTCKEEFCSGCKKPWHSSITCEENARRLAAEGLDDTIGIPFDNDLIKCCPMCAVPIEKDEGCAQMMCKRCKHVFCWYCLASLDDDFLLRHYDKGPCKNKLGHSRASVVWHRAQVIGIFAGFGILLLVASPLLLLAAPCIICCKCRICSGTTKLDDPDTDFDEAIALQR